MTGHLSMTKILLESEWNAYDIIEYCEKNNIKCVIESAENILSMDSKTFVQYVPFCNTTIVQYHLTNLGKTITDTYSKEFELLFHRKIEIMTKTDLEKYMHFPYFMKPVGNTKEFDGQIIKSIEELNELLRDQNNNSQYYVCDVITFVSEYRLFVGNNKIYGVGKIKGKTMHIPELFSENILTCSNNKFYVVDVGFVEEFNDWAVVEINPSFSLDDYGINILTYMQYCIDAWKQYIF